MVFAFDHAVPDAAASFLQIPANRFYRLINHGPCVLITAGTGAGANIAPAMRLAAISETPPLLALPIAERHYTASLIRETKEFTVNIPPEHLLSAVIYAGKASGRNEDKIKIAGLTAKKGLQNGAPYIEECIGHIECRVRESLSYGESLLFIADVLAVRARRDMFDEAWITEKARTVHYLGNSYFATTGKRYRVR